MNIECRRLCGGTACQLQINPDATVGELLRCVSEQVQEPVECLQLCHNTTILDDKSMTNRISAYQLDLEDGVLVLHLMLRAPRHCDWPSTDAWTGCGGNPWGLARCGGNGNCTSKCQDCGARTRWRCCGSNDEDSEFCLPGTTKAQASYNNKITSLPYDPDKEGPKYLELAGDSDLGG